MFYLSERGVIEALLGAAERGAAIRLILDPNRDAFGYVKRGIPNRSVAEELVGESEVRWYQTHGEQFHTKLAVVRNDDTTIATMGSANLTRRNIGDYNLEANLEITMPRSSALDAELASYFDRLWRNERGNQYTVDYSFYRDDSFLTYWRYRIMEATGLSTF